MRAMGLPGRRKEGESREETKDAVDRRTPMWMAFEVCVTPVPRPESWELVVWLNVRSTNIFFLYMYFFPSTYPHSQNANSHVRAHIGSSTRLRGRQWRREGGSERKRVAGWQAGGQAGSEGGEISVGSSAKVTSSQQAAAVSRADCRAAHSHLRLHPALPCPPCPALPCSALRPPRPHSHSQSVSNSILSESQSVESSRESRSKTRDSTLEQSLSLLAYCRFSMASGDGYSVSQLSLPQVTSVASLLH